MADVKGSRRYDASGRREQAARTRAAVVDAAIALFTEHGYRATTVAGIAARAGVSPEGVHKSFGSKAALAKAAFDRAIAGDHDDVPVAQRPAAQAVRAAGSVREKVEIYAADAAERMAGSARVQLLIRDGSQVDRALEPVWRALREERLHGMTMVAAHLVTAPGLRAGLTADDVRDILFWATAVEHYDLLVLQRGWPQQRYAGWLVDTLVGALS